MFLRWVSKIREIFGEKEKKVGYLKVYVFWEGHKSLKKSPIYSNVTE